MEVKVKLNNLRTAPRKVRQVADLVRGKKVGEAQSILLFTVNKSARNVHKLLNSAIATATHDLHLEESNLFISAITVDEGVKLKRWHPMSRGRAYPIIKRSSHIAITLGELKPTNTVAEVKKEEDPKGPPQKAEVKENKKEVIKEAKPKRKIKKK